MPGSELFDDLEKQHIAQVMETGVLIRYGLAAARQGRFKAREMERQICAKAGVEYALLVSSGTSALTCALAALGVGAGDEVIMPSFTFVASFESIIMLGAIPVIVDVDDSLNIDPRAVEAAITPRAKVVLPVHMCGAAANMDALQKICGKHHLLLLEDACQAFGASYKGKFVGAIGDAGCYSFDFNKIVTCGEGGAVVTNDREIYARADMYHDHGHDHSNDDRGAEDHPFIGYNFRICELNAAIGCAQIAKLENFVTRSRANIKILTDALAPVNGVSFRNLPDPDGDCATFRSFFLPSRELAGKAAQALRQNGVDGVFNWFENKWHYIGAWEHFKNRAFMSPIYQQMLSCLPDYGQTDFSQSDNYIGRNISLLVKIGWSREEAQQRARLIVKTLGQVL
jgi:8-amino-3,8-dideoxy-alpha-D-manno-octulosonate transaminase